MAPGNTQCESGRRCADGNDGFRAGTFSEGVRLGDGSHVAYDSLLIATGAEPVHLDVPGGNLPHVHTLRSLADSRAIIDKAKVAQRAVVIGASFIGLEVAAALRARKLEVHVVAPELIPMERILGPEIGGLVRRIHEDVMGFRRGAHVQGSFIYG